MRIVDYKTGRRMWTSAQRQIYMVLGQMLGLPTWYAAYYDARKAELLQTPCKWSRETLTDYVQRAQAQWVSGTRLPSVGQHCDWCQVRAHCAFAP